jgi:hypothetical protein
VATPDLEATLRLPNLERRLKVFVTNEDLRESPTDPIFDRNPLRAGLRFCVFRLIVNKVSRST